MHPKLIFYFSIIIFPCVSSSDNYGLIVMGSSRPRSNNSFSTEVYGASDPFGAIILNGDAVIFREPSEGFP